VNDYRPSRRAQIARWGLRGLMILAIVYLALLRGLDEIQMLGVALAIVWALLLPVLLTWAWRATRGRPTTVRVLVTVAVALLLLVAFAAGVRPLLI